MLAVTLLHLATSAWVAAPADVADFVVAPDGNDAAAGTLEAPFATLERARQAVQALKQAEPDRLTPIAVMLRGGVYELEQPFILTPQDSGSVAAPVLYEAYPGERPVVSAGRRLTGFTVDDRGWWHLTIPEVQRGQWMFSQLFVNNERRFRPRLPKQGYAYIVKEVSPTPANAAVGFDRLRFAEGDIHSGWANLEDVEVLALHVWCATRFRIQSVDDERNVVTFTGPTRSNAYWQSLSAGRRYLVENVREALSDPGQWYLDRLTGELTYVPLPGETPETAEVIAPRLDYCVALQGDPALGMPVEHIRLSGLTFAHTNWVLPPEGHSFPQSEVNLGGTIRAVGASDIAIENCTIAHTGGYGIDLAEGCQRDAVTGCDIYDLGGGGIKVGTQGIPENPALYASDNTVSDCRIAHGGRIHPAAVGIWVGHSPNNTFEYNDVSDFYYSGFSVGWRWGYDQSLAHDNTIAHNHVSNIGQGVLSDMGGIYTLGPSPGTTIHHNRFQDVQSYEYGGWGIYFDEGSSEIVAEDNVCIRTKTGGFHQHYGKENRFVNNILVDSEIGQVQRTRVEEHRSFVFERNIVYWTRGLLLHGNWANDSNYLMDSNLYWNAAGEPVTFAGMSLQDWQARGQDANSLIADPLFEDPAKDDYRLKEGSPALKLGFAPWDLDDVGCRGGDTRPPIPDAPRAFPGWEPMPALPIAEDFEDVPVGEKAPGTMTMEDAAVTTATARVTDENAAAGSRSLKFTDAPGQEFPFNPHAFYQPNYSQGTIVGRFDLWMGPGASFYHEWRKNAQPRYIVGPSITIDPQGKLRTGNRDLATIPLEQWVTIEIRCALGSGIWSLSLTAPRAAQPVVFDELTCDAAFDTLNWHGFCAQANEDAAFYLDNVEVGPSGE